MVAYAFRGDCYGYLKQYDKAVSDGREAFRLNTPLAGSRYELYDALRSSSRAAGAASTSSPTLDSEPTPTPALINERLAKSYFDKAVDESNRASYPAAIEDFTEGIRLMPDDAKLYEHRAYAYDLFGQYGKEVIDWTEVIRLKPYDPEAYDLRGFAYLRLKQYEKAISDCTEAIRLRPENAYAYNLRGNIYYNIQQYDKAFRDFTEAIRLEPATAVFYDNRGNTSDALGDKSKGAQDHKKAKALRGNH